MRRLGREEEGRRIARGDTKSNADVPRGKRIACEMARPDRQRHVRRRGGRRQIFTARSERRPSGRGETARADEKETAGIPVRDEGSELRSARERNGDRCGRPRATETEIARRRSDATCGTTKTGKVGSNEKGGGRELRLSRESDGDGRGEKDNRRGRVRCERGGGHHRDTSRATKSKPRRWDQGEGRSGRKTRRSRRGAFTRERRDG